MKVHHPFLNRKIWFISIATENQFQSNEKRINITSNLNIVPYRWCSDQESTSAYLLSLATEKIWHVYGLRGFSQNSVIALWRVFWWDASQPGIAYALLLTTWTCREDWRVVNTVQSIRCSSLCFIQSTLTVIYILKAGRNIQCPATLGMPFSLWYLMGEDTGTSKAGYPDKNSFFSAVNKSLLSRPIPEGVAMYS